MNSTLEQTLRDAIRTIPDYPKPGILFRDITTLLGNARAFRRAVDELVHPDAGAKVDQVAGIEARGFILGGAIAHQISAGFVPIRKKGKLPHETVRVAYSLEYGVDEMEMHKDAVKPGQPLRLAPRETCDALQTRLFAPDREVGDGGGAGDRIGGVARRVKEHF